MASSTEPPGAASLVVLRDVGKLYGERLVLRHLDLTLQAGEFVSVMGASGAGKTTLLQVIAGLEPPSSGRVSVLGRDLASLSDAELADLRQRAVGYVFQLFNLLPGLNVLENVALPLIIARAPRPAALEAAAAILKRVGLAHRAAAEPETLSSGERQRATLARALVPRPKLLLADEPTAALDPLEAEEFLGLLARWRAEEHLAVLLATHDPRVAVHADRVLRLRAGSLAESGLEA